MRMGISILISIHIGGNEMARNIAICNQKGGVAKTTTAIALATGLAKRGYKVLMVDTDPQCNTTGVYQAEIDGVATIHDLLFTRRIDPFICIQHTEIGDIIAGDSIMETDNANLNGLEKTMILKNALQPFQDHYDFIFFDQNPGYSGIMNNVLNASDEVIIPMQTDGFSIDGCAGLAQRINTVQKFTNPNLKIAGILLTLFNGRTTSAQLFLQQKEVIEKVFDSKIFETKIRRSQPLSDANSNRMSIFDYDPKSNGALDYDSVIDEYLETYKGVK